MQDSDKARHPTARNKEKKPIVLNDVDTPANDELFSGSSPNLSPVKSSRARSRQRHSHRPAFGNVDNGTFNRARKEKSRGQNQPNKVPGKASALSTGVVPPIQPVYPAFSIGPTLYISPAATIQSLDNMFSSP